MYMDREWATQTHTGMIQLKVYKEVANMGTERERKDTQKAVLYDLRRLIKNSDKETYTKDELCDLLDTIADAKDQE